MKIILYISYGTGLHEQEALFSLLTARHWTGLDEGGDMRVIILTDHPDHFAGLPAMVEYISTEQWREWAGPSNFNHRRKILALRHVLQKYRAPTVLLDADTYIRKHPSELFARIAPGKTLMHIREARIGEIDTPQGHMLADFLRRDRFVDQAGRELAIPLETYLWNAGVVGIDPADSGLVDEVLHLTDQFCARSSLHILEQLAFSFLLAQRTKLGEVPDIIFHYWPPYLHLPFKDVLPKLVADTAGLALPQRIERFYAARPRPTFVRRVKVVLKRIVQAFGLLPGRSRSNEW